MHKTIVVLLLIPLSLIAQVFPKEGSLLNYRIIGFSYPNLRKAKEYKIEIAKGNYAAIDSFTRNIVQSAESKDKRIIAEVPAFGSQYTWRIVYKRERATESTPLCHFSTLMNDHADTNKLHLRILQPADEQYRDDYVSVDAGGVLYDMTGNPVWFIPDTNGIGGNVGDLKFTHEGTITFLYGKKNCEINYNADIIWRTPKKESISGDSTAGEIYHHEFTKLSNGHYMALGTQVFACKSIVTKDTSFFIISKKKDSAGHDGFKLGKFGTIIEYDVDGNVVWSWKSFDYLYGSDFNYYKGIDSNLRFDGHDNAFFFDEKNRCVYLGFRSMNRIVVIDYPSGKVLRTYGESFKPGVTGIGAGLFCNQHSIGRTRDGYLYIFNNNSCGLVDSLPTVVMLQEPESPNGSFKKIWEYTCTIDGYYPQGYQKIFGSGGNAIELPDGSFFVCMGSNYGKMFIVSRDKKIFWNALPERFMETDQKWTPIHEYRGNIISRKDLEKMIWNAENIDSSYNKN